LGSHVTNFLALQHDALSNGGAELLLMDGLHSLAMGELLVIAVPLAQGPAQIGACWSRSPANVGGY